MPFLASGEYVLIKRKQQTQWALTNVFAILERKMELNLYRWLYKSLTYSWESSMRLYVQSCSCQGKHSKHPLLSPLTDFRTLYSETIPLFIHHFILKVAKETMAGKLEASQTNSGTLTK